MTKIPVMGTLAAYLAKLRAEGRHAEADAQVKAQNMINRAWGEPDYDEASELTDQPMEGGFTFGRHRA